MIVCVYAYVCVYLCGYVYVYECMNNILFTHDYSLFKVNYIYR